MTHPTTLTINSERLSTDFDELAQIGATVDGGVSRLALSNEDLEARLWLANRFEQTGLLVKDDAAGNLSGVLRCPNPDAKTLLIGSHLDSVPNGGRYDGSIGILAGLECARTLQDAPHDLPFHLEIINFTDEEGCWQSLFGSRALTGNLVDSIMSDSQKDFGPFRAALFRAGIRPSEIYLARREPETLIGYLEMHIEQSTVLDDSDVSIGVVTGIVGRQTYQITFRGEAAHSGTTRASARRDALLGAAQFITNAHRLVDSEFPSGVLNCGNLTVKPGAFNVIPSLARVTIETRHADKDLLIAQTNTLLDLARAVADEHALNLELIQLSAMPAATMAGSMVLALEKSCQALDISSIRMTSFAGHDAQFLSGFCPTGMIFVPSVGGISHSPKEFTPWQRVVEGTQVLLNTILHLAEIE